MEFFVQYRWVLIPVGIFLFFKFFVKSKGGLVVSEVAAEFEVHDPLFDTCKPEARYVTFKRGKPQKIDIEVERLPLQFGEALDVHVNRKPLTTMTVEKDLEAEFEHWSDGVVYFPPISAGDTIEIYYREKLVLSGVFTAR